MNLIKAPDFAVAMEIAETTARAAFRACASGKTWRNFDLPIIERTNGRGGASGKISYLVIDELAPELQRLFEVPSNNLQTSQQTLIDEQTASQAAEAAHWRWSVIRDVYGMPKGPKRTAEIERISGQTHHFDGACQ